MTSETYNKKTASRTLSLLYYPIKLIVQYRKIILLLSCAAVVINIFNIISTANAGDPRDPGNTEETYTNHSSVVAEAQTIKRPLQLRQRTKKPRVPDDNRLAVLFTAIQNHMDVSKLDKICKIIESDIGEFVGTGIYRDSDWINFKNNLRKCFQLGSPVMWPFPEERLKCCIGKLPQYWKMQLTKFDSSDVTYPRIDMRNKEASLEKCYMMTIGMPQVWSELKQLIHVHYSHCLFRGVDINDDWFDGVLQPQLLYDFNVMFASEIFEDGEMTMDEAVEQFELRDSVIDTVLVHTNVSSIDAVNFVTKFRSPVICQLTLNIQHLDTVTFNDTTISTLFNKFIDESDLIPIWVTTKPFFQLFAVNVMHPKCRERYIAPVE